MAVSGCAIIVVDEKGNERKVDSWFDIKPNERIVDYTYGPQNLGPITFSQAGLDRYGPNRYAAGTQRYIVGAELGISNFRAETDHFFAPANVAGSSAGVTGTLFGGYHYAMAHDPINMSTDWLRGEASITLGDMSVRTPPNFGNETLSSQLKYRADLSFGYSKQFHKNQSRPTDICVFVLVGPSFGKVEYDFANFSGSKDKWGWHVGGGIEVEFAKNWVVRSEVRYANLGKFGIGPGIDVEHADTSFRLGVGYRQNFGAAPPPPR
jgi:opacity protein-like surface antigen